MSNYIIEQMRKISKHISKEEIFSKLKKGELSFLKIKYKKLKRTYFKLYIKGYLDGFHSQEIRKSEEKK